jgi:hypothetical protein
MNVLRSLGIDAPFSGPLVRVSPLHVLSARFRRLSFAFTGKLPTSSQVHTLVWTLPFRPPGPSGIAPPAVCCMGFNEGQTDLVTARASV